MKSFEALVYVQNGSTRLPHTVRLQADTMFNAQQQLVGMYGSSNVINMPYEVGGSAPKGNYNSAPWMSYNQ